MYKFIYKAKRKDGQYVQDVIWSESMEEARLRLSHQDLLLFSLREIKEDKPFWKGKLWTKKKIIFFSFQMGTLLEAGLSLLHIMKLLQRGKGHLPCDQISEAIERGIPLHAVLRDTGFPPLGCALIEAGEMSGTLGQSFLFVKGLYEREKKQLDKWKQLMIYPIFICLVMTIFFLGAIFFILPTFKEVFSSMNVPLPATTAALLKLGEYIKSHPLHIFLTLIVFLILIRFLCTQKAIVDAVHAYMWNAWGSTNWYGGFQYSRVFHVLQLLIQSGLTLTEALALTEPLWTNRKAQECLKSTITFLEEGKSFKEALEESCIGTPFIYELVGAGEDAGELEEMIGQCANYYEGQVIRTIEKVERLIEPLLMTIMGIVVGALVVSVMVPLFKAINSISTL